MVILSFLNLVGENGMGADSAEKSTPSNPPDWDFRPLRISVLQWHFIKVTAAWARC